MKKVILSTAILASIGLAANAQQGSWYIGGNLGYNQTQAKTETSGTVVNGVKNSSWSFNPEIGTFLSDNFQLGVALNLVGTNTDYNDANSTISKSKNLGGTLYGRYFFGAGAFRPFLGVNVTALSGTGETTNSNPSTVKSTSSFFGANLNAGFALALSPRVTAVGSFGALGFSQSTSQVTGSNVKNINSGFGFENAGTLGQRFNVGIYYTFSK